VKIEIKKEAFLLLCIAFLTAVIFFAEPLPAAEDDSFTEGYKNARWGMSQEQVKPAFPDMAFQQDDDDILYFLSRIADENVNVMFMFFDNRLFRVLLNFDIEEGAGGDYVAAFYKFDNYLRLKYGEPQHMVEPSPDNEFGGGTDFIASGKGLLASQWETKESTIRLSLTGTGGRLNLGIYYRSNRLEEQFKVFSELKTRHNSGHLEGNFE